MWQAALAAGLNVAGQIADKNREEKFNRLQYEYQREFAQKGIQWRVEDAKAAGIHPLYALGASTAGYQPVNSFGSSSFAEAGARAAQAISGVQAQKIQMETLRLNRDLIQSEVNLNNAQAEAELSSIRTGLSGLSGQPATPQDALQALSATDNPYTRTIEAVQTAPVEGAIAGAKVLIDSGNMTPASFWEERYGEPGEWIFGPLNMLQDIGVGLYGALERLSRDRDSGLSLGQIRRNVEDEVRRRGTKGSYFRYLDSSEDGR